jgi:hypothetical protein
MDIASHQRTLLGLIRSTYQVGDGDDAYIQRVATSKDLKEAQRNIFLWRIYVLERTARLTFNLLKKRRLLEPVLSSFIARHNISPFRETQAPAFLEELSCHSDGLIASVAHFELALNKVREGDPRRYAVLWSVEPHGILNSLAKDLPLEDDAPEGIYQTLVSCDLPYQFQIVALLPEGS